MGGGEGQGAMGGRVKQWGRLLGDALGSATPAHTLSCRRSEGGGWCARVWGYMVRQRGAGMAVRVSGYRII